jgi:hypothetical protein
MSRPWIFAIGFLVGAVVATSLAIAHTHLHRALHHGHEAQNTGGKQETGRTHTEEKFSFVANAPMETVAPLFGAEKEKIWSPGWSPNFVHPLPPNDEQGMVFTVAHSHMTASWVNTEFDLKNGRIQYVYMIPDAMVTVITLHLTPQNEQTKVDVAYDRTSLTADADEHVQHMAAGDRQSGPEWEKQVNDYLRSAAKNAAH